MGQSELRLHGVLRSSPAGDNSRTSSQVGGIGVAWASNSSSSEARMIAECILCTRLSCDALHSSIASSMAAVLTTSWLVSTSSLNCLCCSRAVSNWTGFTQSKDPQTEGSPNGSTLDALLLDELPELSPAASAQGLFLRPHEQPSLPLQAPGLEAVFFEVGEQFLLGVLL